MLSLECESYFWSFVSLSDTTIHAYIRCETMIIKWSISKIHFLHLGTQMHKKQWRSPNANSFSPNAQTQTPKCTICFHPKTPWSKFCVILQMHKHN